MDENGTAPVNYRNFGLPLCLLSLAFFILYVLIASWLLSENFQSLLELFMPFSTASPLASSFPYAACGLVFLVSALGSLLLVTEMKARSVPRNSGLMLCAVFGVIISCAVLFVTLPSPDVRKYTGLIVLVTFASLPLCVALLLDRLKKHTNSLPGINTVRSIAMPVGFFGLFIALVLVFSTLTYVPPPPDPSHDNFLDFDPIALIGAFFGLIVLAVLMPAVGILLLRLGLRLRRTPQPAGEPGEKPDRLPEKKAGPGFSDAFYPRTPAMRWTVVLLVLLGLAAVGYGACWMFTDATPGKTWTMVTSSAPFGSKGGFTTAEYKGKLWLIGGTGYQGPSGEAWYTTDGITWTRESSADMVPQRMGASSVVFRDALWVTGGTTERTFTLNNDVWYSGNGMNWSQIQPAAAFSPRNGHSTTVFRDRIWVIGGNQGAETNNLTNDIWYSDDGITWQQATTAAEFSPRSGHSVVVYHGRLWLVGGWDNTGDLNDVWSSDDGISWTRATASAEFARGSPVRAVAFDDRMWVVQNFYVMDPDRPWIIDRSQGFWYSTDGVTWRKLISSPEFFRKEYFGQPPLPVVFDNRLWILQEHNSETGIWFTMPGDRIPAGGLHL